MHTQARTTATPVHAARRLLFLSPGTRLVPPAGTLVLCALTVGVFVAQTIAGDGQWIRAAGALYTSGSQILPITRVGEGQTIPVWLTLFTYMFLHGHWWHLLSNMLVVWWLGTVAEPAWGTTRFLVAYLACGVAGAIAIGVVVPHSLTPAFGASLAYCGVLGAYAALRLPHRVSGHGRALVPVLEAAAVLLVGAWFSDRAARAEWERSVMYHFLPFMLAWFSVRIWNAFRRVRSRPS